MGFGLLSKPVEAWTNFRPPHYHSQSDGRSAELSVGCPSVACPQRLLGSSSTCHHMAHTHPRHNGNFQGDFWGIQPAFELENLRHSQQDR